MPAIGGLSEFRRFEGSFTAKAVADLPMFITLFTHGKSVKVTA